MMTIPFADFTPMHIEIREEMKKAFEEEGTQHQLQHIHYYI